MFESLIESRAENGGRAKKSWWLSLLIHGGVIAIFLIAPLIHYSELQVSLPLTYLVAAPVLPQPTPPVPPPAPQRTSLHRRQPSSQPVVVVDDLRMEPTVPDPPSAEDLPWIPVTSGTDIAGVALPGVPPTLSGVPGGDGILGRESIPPPPPPPASEKKPVRVGGEIQQARKIVHVQPIYPELARKVRVEGIVVLEARIDEVGNVSSLRILRGHPLLNQAALDAVKQWKYSPTLLNGEPVPVMTTISVVFSLR